MRIILEIIELDYMNVKVKKAIWAVFLVLVTVLIGLAFIIVRTGFLSDKPAVSEKIGLPTSEKISTIVVPHFNTFQTERRDFLKKISGEVSPKKIVVVSVNHYGLGEKDFLTTQKSWDFSVVDPKINTELFDSLIKSGQVGADETVFENEHGIKNVLPDLAEYFPESSFLPVIVKETALREKTKEFSGLLYSECPDCLLVSSIDFSHYNPNSLAQIHDVMSLSALNSLDEEKAWTAETDSPQALLLTLLWAGKRNTQKFNLELNSNTGEKAKNDDIETTSVILGYFSSGEKSQFGKKTTFVIAGDAMFDRFVYHSFKSKGLEDIFKKFGPRVFAGADLALVNLEGPISSGPIIDDISPDNLIFNFPSKTPDALKFAKIKAVSLANNHTLNAGAQGFSTTQDILRNNSILFAGHQSQIGEQSVLRVEAEIPLSIITVNSLEGSNGVGGLVEKEKSAGRFVLVFPHWGNEYQKVHSPAQQKLARSWIDSGADFIVGSHPHVVQDFEIYKSRPIVYSLGNFVFDQGFSRETQEGLILAGIISDKELQLTFLPTEEISIRPQLQQGDKKTKNIAEILDINSQNGFAKLSSDTIKINR